jgi:hypothetical protein
LDVLHIEFCRSVKDRHLGTINLHEAVVYSKGIEGCQGVLHGAATGIALGEYGATCRLDDVLSDGLDDGRIGKIYALNLISMVHGGGIECDGKIQTGMEAFALESEATS